MKPHNFQPAADKNDDPIGENIAAVQEFYDRENGKLSRSQRLIERISGFVGSPAFIAYVLVVVALWIAANTLLVWLGYPEFDAAPYFALQGIVSLCALLIGSAVLTKQNRMAHLAEHRANLDLKVTLLTEQKAAKLIDLMEELRRDLPNVNNRPDPAADTLQEAMNPSRVLDALDEYPGPLDISSEKTPEHKASLA